MMESGGSGAQDFSSRALELEFRGGGRRSRAPRIASRSRIAAKWTRPLPAPTTRPASPPGTARRASRPCARPSGRSKGRRRRSRGIEVQGVGGIGGNIVDRHGQEFRVASGTAAVRADDAVLRTVGFAPVAARAAFPAGRSVPDARDETPRPSRDVLDAGADQGDLAGDVTQPRMNGRLNLGGQEPIAHGLEGQGGSRRRRARGALPTSPGPGLRIGSVGSGLPTPPNCFDDHRVHSASHPNFCASWFGVGTCAGF